MVQVVVVPLWWNLAPEHFVRVFIGEGLKLAQAENQALKAEN